MEAALLDLSAAQGTMWGIFRLIPIVLAPSSSLVREPRRNRTRNPEDVVTTSSSPDRPLHESANLSQTKTIERHILDQQNLHPDAGGRFTNIMYVIALTAKLVQREVS